MKLVKESLDTPPKNPFSQETINTIMDHARYGSRIKVNDRGVWAGLGDRTSLYSFADDLCFDKFQKGKDRLRKKLESLDKYKDYVEIWEYYNTGRFKGKWEKKITFHAKK